MCFTIILVQKVLAKSFAKVFGYFYGSYEITVNEKLELCKAVGQVSVAFSFVHFNILGVVIQKVLFELVLWNIS